MAHNVIETRTEDPERVASRIVARGAHLWWTECESDGCTNLVGQPKRRYIYTDYTKGVNDATPTILIHYSAPGARLCKECS